MESNLLLTCGIPASGKSTFAKQFVEESDGKVLRVSRDEIRFSMLSGDEDYFAHEQTVFKKFVEQIKDGLKKYDLVIADATHLNRSSRKKLLNELKDSLKNKKVGALVFDVPFEVAVERNNKRTGLEKVPYETMRSMNSKFVIPSYNEGFSEIFVLKMKGSQ